MQKVCRHVMGNVWTNCQEFGEKIQNLDAHVYHIHVLLMFAVYLN
jgi:uncharacterized membrane protein